MCVALMRGHGAAIGAARLDAGHAPLALDRHAGRLVLGVKLHMLGIFFRHRRQRLVHVEFGVRVRFDPAHDGLEMAPALGKLCGLAGNVCGIAAIEQDG